MAKNCSVWPTAPVASFLDDLGECLAEHAVPPDKLCFEIGGAAAVIDMQKSRVTMEGMRKLGCKVALGGFGSGMVTLGYLKLLPADFLKIDGAFVSMITQSIVDEKMVASVNEIAHLMGQQTIAECVEDQATGAALSRIGVDYLHGYGIGYPEELSKIALGVT